MTQEWFCETCAETGAVDVPDGADVMAGVFLVGLDHIAASPKCPGDPAACLRVRGAGCSDEEWQELTQAKRSIQ
jgi:hypothetical protein